MMVGIGGCYWSWWVRLELVMVGVIGVGDGR